MNRRLFSITLGSGLLWAVLVFSTSHAGGARAKNRAPGLCTSAIAFHRQSRRNRIWERLRELGWVEGQNLVIEARWADGRAERLSGAHVRGDRAQGRRTCHLGHDSRGRSQEGDQHDPDRRCSDVRYSPSRSASGPTRWQLNRTVGGVCRRLCREMAGAAAGDGPAALSRCRDRKPRHPDK